MRFAVTFYERPDRPGLRDANRAAHLDYLDSIAERIVFAGPMLTDDGKKEVGSLLLVDFPDKAAAEKHAAAEPYVTCGLQDRYTIQRWEAWVPYTWRDCPRREGNLQFVVHAMDRPNAGDLRARLGDEHEAFQVEAGDIYLTRGPILTDDGSRQIGSLMIIDVPDQEAAWSFWCNVPFNAAGLFKTVEIHRWRFGRRFDQFAKK